MRSELSAVGCPYNRQLITDNSSRSRSNRSDDSRLAPLSPSEIRGKLKDYADMYASKRAAKGGTEYNGIWDDVARGVGDGRPLGGRAKGREDLYTDTAALVGQGHQKDLGRDLFLLPFRREHSGHREDRSNSQGAAQSRRHRGSRRWRRHLDPAAERL